MTVPVQTIFTASTANGVTTVFPYSFKITEEDDLAVTVDGVIQTSGYTVSGVGDDAGGNVTFSVAPANGTKVVRYLAPILQRVTDYPQFGDWLADVVNADFDRIWLTLQAKNQDTSRSIKLPVDTSDDQTITEDAATRAGKFISFDSSGNVTLSVLADLTTLAAVSAFMETLLDDANAATACATLGARMESDDVRVAAGKVIVFEGATDDAFELTLSCDPGADRTIDLDNVVDTNATNGEVTAGTEAGTRNLSPAQVKLAVNTHAITMAAAQASTSGTSIVFGSIPSGVKRITVMLNGVSTNGTSAPILQIGDAGGIETSGYVGSGTVVRLAANPIGSTITNGLLLNHNGAAAAVIHGQAVLTHMGSNVWSMAWNGCTSDAIQTLAASSSKTLSAELTQLSITTAGGTDAFDAGSINVLYE